MSRFSVDITNVSDERALIPAGDYPIRITKGTVKQDSKEKDGKVNNYVMINFVAGIRDEEVATLLGQDEPKCFPTVFISCDETWAIGPNNQQLGKFLKAAGFNSNEPFEVDTEDCEDQKAFTKKFFENMAEAAVGLDFTAKIGTRTYNDETQNEVKALAPALD